MAASRLHEPSEPARDKSSSGVSHAPGGGDRAKRGSFIQQEAVAAEYSRDRVHNHAIHYRARLARVHRAVGEQAAQLREQLFRLRGAAADAAAAEGLRICAAGTPVLAACAPAPIGEHPRYRAGVAQYRGMLDDFAICALHVHVRLPDAEVAVLVGNHLRPWLPLLVALSANSPFHQGRDTGYADWRAVIRSRFPCLGPPPYAESLRHQSELAAAMAESEAMLNADTPYWDIRANSKFSTVEIRSMDVNADLDDTVAVTILVRALVATSTARVLAGDPGPRPCSELLRAAGAPPGTAGRAAVSTR